MTEKEKKSYRTPGIKVVPVVLRAFASSPYGFDDSTTDKYKRDDSYEGGME